MLLKLLGKIIGIGKKTVQKKLKKKARRKLRKIIRKAAGAAVVCFGIVMIYQHRRPIMAAITGKKLPMEKCPVFKKA